MKGSLFGLGTDVMGLLLPVVEQPGAEHSLESSSFATVDAVGQRVSPLAIYPPVVGTVATNTV